MSPKPKPQSSFLPDRPDTTLQHHADSGSIPGEASFAASADQEQTKKSRPKYPKVRTGCVNCKKRHVKCDETKPSCNRCLKWKGACSGYVSELRTPSPPLMAWGKGVKEQHWAATSSRDEHATHGERILLPKRSTQFDDYHEELGRPTQPLWQTQGFRQDDSGALGLEFWEETAPQLIRDHPAVHLASQAALMILPARRLSTNSSKAAGSLNETDGRAFDCYGQALRALVQAEMGSEDLRPAILCSLFFIIFEILHNDIPAMQAHLESGQRMLDEFLRTRGDVDFMQQGGLRAELGHALHFLLYQAGNNTMVEGKHNNQLQASYAADEFELFDMLEGI